MREPPPLWLVEEEPPPMPHRHSDWRRCNIVGTLWHAAFEFTGSSIWGNNVLSECVCMLHHDHAALVGFVTGVVGLTNLVASLLAGWVANAGHHNAVLQAASTVHALAIGVMLLAFVRHAHAFSLMPSLALWVASQGMANVALQALFADSTPMGKFSCQFMQQNMHAHCLHCWTSCVTCPVCHPRQFVDCCGMCPCHGHGASVEFCHGHCFVLIQ